MNSDYSNNFNQYSSSTNVAGNREFLNSNSLIAKFAFLLLVIVLFVIALRLGSSIFSWIFSPSPNPILINGMVDSKQMLVIQQDPSIKGSIPIMRSVDDAQGMEFTWSVWMYIDDFTYKQNEYKHVFHKGNDDINVTNPPIGLNYPNNAPGLYITPDTNDLIVIMNTFDTINETVLIKDIPLNKWINVIIRLNNQHQLDIYINGTLTKRHMLKGVAKQNYGNVYASMNGGFSGYTSELRYFGSAIGTNKIQDIVNKGPNMNMNSADLTKTKPHYLSTRWYFAGSNDEYNS
jgi:hypothetical protein